MSQTSRSTGNEQPPGPGGLPPLTWLRAFEASARHLSFTRAAGELNLTQSAVSQHVRSLEAFLGREMFVRKTRAIALTEAGEIYLPVVREAFDLLASGTQAFTGGDRGRHLVVQCSLAFAARWLAPRLPNLQARAPWLVLNIVAAIWNPDRQGAQAAPEIRFARRETLSDSAETLTVERYFPVCRPDAVQSVTDLETAPLLDCPGISGTWAKWHKTQGLPFDRTQDITLTSSFVIALEASRFGAGVCMAHDTLVRDAIAEGTLAKPFDHSPPLTEAYHLLPPSSHAATPASRVFRDWLHESCAEAGVAP